MRGRRPLEPDDLDAIEEALLAADFGVPATQDAMEVARAPGAREIADGRARRPCAPLLRERDRASPRPARLSVRPFSAQPWVVFVVGVNGVGKTTTIGKLAARLAGARARTTLLVRRRHLPRRGGRAARDLGRARGRRASTAAREGADPAAVLTDAPAHGAGRGLRRACSSTPPGGCTPRAT